MKPTKLTKLEKENPGWTICPCCQLSCIACLASGFPHPGLHYCQNKHEWENKKMTSKQRMEEMIKDYGLREIAESLISWMQENEDLSIVQEVVGDINLDAQQMVDNLPTKEWDKEKW